MLDEAYRPVTIRENDEAITVPLMQAAMRSLGIAAVKGSARAQSILAALVHEAEAKAVADQMTLFDAMLAYKKKAAEIIDSHVSVGRAPPELVPHPDDIQLDFKEAKVIFNGPMDEREKAKWDKLIAYRADLVEENKELEVERKRSRGGPREQLASDIAQNNTMIDLVGAFIPSEELRRKPGFDVREWRLKQPAAVKLLEERDALEARKDRALAKRLRRDRT